MFGKAKIKSIKSIGTRQTYNIEMESTQHNYLLSNNYGQPIHRNSHSCAYILVAYWCAWLKTYFAPEWWAAVMSGCYSDRIPKYMNTARLEGVQFGSINIGNLTKEFSVSREFKVTPGLISIKGIGDKSANKLIGSYNCDNIDEFINEYGKSKRDLEPLIKLGAFTKQHSNIKATWMWYQYKYCSGKDITKLRTEIRDLLIANWTDDKIKTERDRQVDEYKKLYPKRKKLPDKIIKWKPKADDSRENVMALFQDDFTLREILSFEKQYLGYYWHSPLDLYITKGGMTIQSVKESDGHRGNIEVIVESIIATKTKNNNKMGKLQVTDGLSSATIFLWSDQMDVFGPYMSEGMGLRIDVKYDSGRNNFTLASKSSVPIPLITKEEYRDEESDE